MNTLQLRNKYVELLHSVCLLEEAVEKHQLRHGTATPFTGAFINIVRRLSTRGTIPDRLGDEPTMKNILRATRQLCRSIRYKLNPKSTTDVYRQVVKTERILDHIATFWKPSPCRKNSEP